MLARVLCGVLALGSIHVQDPVPDACFVRVERGRARLGHGEEGREMIPSLLARPLEVGDSLELGASSAVELAWRARASARIQGPGALEIAPRGNLWLDRFACAELEVRRGTLAVLWAEGGQLELGPGAVQLTRVTAGVFELYHRGGEPLAWRILDERGAARAGWLRPGERIRLGARALSAALPCAP